MKTKTAVCCAIVCGLMVPARFGRTVAPPPTKPTRAELQAELGALARTFCDRHGLSRRELADIVTDGLLREPYLRKGGLGLLDGGTYIELDGERNGVQMRGEDRWMGAASTIDEAVLLDGDRVLGSFPGIDPTRLRVLVFERDEVGFLEWGPRRGGVYRRFLGR